MATTADTFDRADGALGADWTVTSGSITIQGNAAKLAVQGTRATARREFDCGSPDMAATIVETAASSHYADSAVTVRHSTTADTYYAGRIIYRSTSGNTFREILKIVNGVEANVGSNVEQLYSRTYPDTVRLEAQTVDGAVVLRLFIDGTQVATATDPANNSPLLTGSRGGMSQFASHSTTSSWPTVDSFSVESMSTGQTIAVGQATEADTATTLTAFGPKTIPLGQATETDTATPLGGLDPFSTDFPGTTLPDGWAFHSALGDGSVAVTDSWAAITLPAGAAHDGIASLAGADNTVGIRHALTDHGGNIDVAVYLGTDISDQLGLGWNLTFTNTGGDACRFAVYHRSDDADTEYIHVYGYARSAGASVNTTILQFDKYMTGVPAWLRVTYTAATGVWSFQHSSDGHEWTSDRTRDTTTNNVSLTRSFTADTFKVSLSSNGATPPGITGRVGKVVDVLARGTTDLRDPAPTRSPSTISAFTGTAGALPAGWVDASVGSSGLSWTGTALRLTDVGAVEFDRAAFRWTGDDAKDWGLLLRLANPSGSTSYFFTPGMGVIEAATGDQYVGGPGYGLEVQQRGMIRRPIRIDSTADQTISPAAPYVTDLDETPYCHLKDIRDGYDLSLGGTRWFRIERAGSRLRFREWADGDIEPTVWNLYDGQDEVEHFPSRPFLSLSHNGTRSGSNVTDVYDVEFYRLGTVVALGQAVDGETSQSLVALKVERPVVTVTLGQALDVTEAAALPASKARTLGQATTTDTAQLLTAVVPNITVVDLGQAVDTHTSLTVTPAKTRTLAGAVETDTVHSLTARVPQVLVLGRAEEVDLAWTITEAADFVPLPDEARATHRDASRAVATHRDVTTASATHRDVTPAQATNKPASQATATHRENAWQTT